MYRGDCNSNATGLTIRINFFNRKLSNFLSGILLFLVGRTDSSPLLVLLSISDIAMNEVN